MVRPLNCPICQSPVDPQAKTLPFCSVRCQQVDLLRWTKGDYAIVEPLRPEDMDPDAFDELPPGWGQSGRSGGDE